MVAWVADTPTYYEQSRVGVRRQLFLLAVIVLASTSIARAADCANAADQSTMNECADQSHRKSDAELNALYKQVQQRLKDDASKSKLLTAAQRAWVVFRDAECKFSVSGVEGGSIQPMIYSGCIDGLTMKRVDDLKNYLKCQEGDMSCPVPANDQNPPAPRHAERRRP